jgi:hypothetical protein
LTTGSRRHELQGALAEQLGLVVLLDQPLGGDLVVLEGVLQVAVVQLVALAGGLVQVVVAVGQEEVSLVQARVRLDGVLVLRRGAAIVLLGVEGVGVLEVLARLQLAKLSAADEAQAQRSDDDPVARQKTLRHSDTFLWNRPENGGNPGSIVSPPDTVKRSGTVGAATVSWSGRRSRACLAAPHAYLD